MPVLTLFCLERSGMDSAYLLNASSSGRRAGDKIFFSFNREGAVCLARRAFRAAGHSFGAVDVALCIQWRRWREHAAEERLAKQTWRISALAYRFLGAHLGKHGDRGYRARRAAKEGVCMKAAYSVGEKRRRRNGIIKLV